MTTEKEFVSGLDFSHPLLTIRYDELSADINAFLDINDQECDMRNVQPISSYNWLGNPAQPMMIVPGKPKRLMKWRGGQLKPDTEGLMADENHIMIKNCPMQPLFVAIKVAVENDEAPITDQASQEFKFQSFDFATDRNNLRKLFKFLENQGRPEPFRIDIQLISNLICLIRVQKEDLEFRSVKTYGRDFEHHMTQAQDAMCSGSYRQVISYEFGNLKILMRFEIDCADLELGETAQEAQTRKEAALASKVAAEKDPRKGVVEAASYETVGIEKDKKDSKDPEALADFLKKVSISSPSDRANGPLKVILHGDWRRYHLVEVATRRYYRGEKSSFPEHVWAQLFFSQMPTFILGYQNYGKVGPKDIERYTFKEVEDKCGGFPLAKVARLHDLLEKIAGFVRDNARQNDIFSVFWDPSFGNELKIFGVENPQRFAVSDGLRKLIAEN